MNAIMRVSLTKSEAIIKLPQQMNAAECLFCCTYLVLGGEMQPHLRSPAWIPVPWSQAIGSCFQNLSTVFEFSLNVFTEFTEYSDKKGLEPATQPPLV